MASCECCRDKALERCPDGGDFNEVYHEVMREHEAHGCVCVQNTDEGRKARAGQFWDEERQVDKRDAFGGHERSL